MNHRVWTMLEDPTERFVGCLDWTALDMAAAAGHEDIIRYLLERHPWSEMALQSLVEHCVYWNHEALLHQILSKQQVYLGNALFECLKWKRYNILPILYKYNQQKMPFDFFRQVGIGGHLRALIHLCALEKMAFEVWMRMLCEAAS